LPKLEAIRPDYAETKKAGGDARGEQRRLRVSAAEIFPIIINSLPKRILNRKSVLVHITNTSIVQEIAEALVANGNRTPKMNRWIEKAPKKKRDSIERTLQIWIKECRGVVEKRVQ
jgi:hypothetical protein